MPIHWQALIIKPHELIVHTELDQLIDQERRRGGEVDVIIMAADQLTALVLSTNDACHVMDEGKFNGVHVPTYKGIPIVIPRDLAIAHRLYGETSAPTRLAVELEIQP